MRGRLLNRANIAQECALPDFDIVAIGRVSSSLTDLASAPRQADEGAPAAWLVFDRAFEEGLRNITPGDRLVVLTWLDRARRDVLTVHPPGETSPTPPRACRPR